MYRVLLLVFLGALLLFSHIPFTRAGEIVLAADEWCPYNCGPQDEDPGFLVEIARAVFEEKGFRVSYVNVPWARAIYGTRTGQYDGIIGTGKEESPECVFPDIEQGLARHTFYVKKGTLWRYTGLASLEDITLGVIRNYSYGSLYQDYILPNQGNPKLVQVISGEQGLALNIQKLQAGRIEALIEDRAVFEYFLQVSQIPDQFTAAGVASVEQVYIAFSPKLEQAQSYADLLSQGMRELRATGKLARILQKYGLEDQGGY